MTNSQFTPTSYDVDIQQLSRVASVVDVNGHYVYSLSQLAACIVAIAIFSSVLKVYAVPMSYYS